ncbi:STAS domain-containing protein [Streptomyces sp. A5-4]|uniref:STAS domain-containing protein n=1 Tax=Streptomyces sp. A5-4 TaxID=3384771 RepID=UPI003DA8B644
MNPLGNWTVLTRAAAWLVAAAAAGWLLTQVDSPSMKLLCLIASAAALRIAAMSLRTALSPRPTRHHAVVRLRGEISARNAGKTARRLTAALNNSPATLEIDLTRVTRITNDGTGALFHTARAATPAGVTLIITGANADVRATLHTIGLDNLLRYSPD